MADLSMLGVLGAMFGLPVGLMLPWASSAYPITAVGAAAGQIYGDAYGFGGMPGAALAPQPGMFGRQLIGMARFAAADEYLMWMILRAMLGGGGANQTSAGEIRKNPPAVGTPPAPTNTSSPAEAPKKSPTPTPEENPPAKSAEPTPSDSPSNAPTVAPQAAAPKLKKKPTKHHVMHGNPAQKTPHKTTGLPLTDPPSGNSLEKPVEKFGRHKEWAEPAEWKREREAKEAQKNYEAATRQELNNLGDCRGNADCARHKSDLQMRLRTHRKPGL